MSYNNKKLLISLIVIAIILRLLVIINYGDFWFDEIFSFTYSQKPWLDSLKFWAWETNPPLHLVFLKFWFYIFPANEFWARIPSLVFGVLSVVFLYNFALKNFNQHLALVAAILLALQPYHIFISATARGYALLIMLAILSLNYFFRIFIAGNRTTKNYLIFAIINLLFAYTHLTSCFIFFGQLIVAGLNHKKNILTWLKINSIPFFIWLIWALPAGYNKLNSSTFSSAWFLNMKINLPTIIQTLQSLLVGTINWKYGLLSIIATVLAVLFVIYRQKRQQNIEEKFLYLLIFIIIILTSSALWKLWNFKFILVSLPVVMLTLAYIITNLTKSKLSWLLIIGLFIIPGTKTFLGFLPLNHWTGINNFIAQNTNYPKKQILIYNLFTNKLLMDRYYHQTVPRLAYEEKKITNWDETLIKNNYLRYIRSEAEIQQWLKTINIDQYDEIFLLQNPLVGINLSTVLVEQGWLAKTQPFYPRLTEPEVLTLYAKP